MPRPNASRCTLDVNSVTELRPSERLISWIQRLDDFEPPLQDQTQPIRPNTPSQNGAREQRPSTPEFRTVAQSDTRSVALSRSRYCQTFVTAESAQDQGRDTKSVITLSRSRTPSARPKTPKRPASPYVKKEYSGSASPTSPISSSKKSRGRENTRNPSRRTRKEPIDEKSQAGGPRNLAPPQSRASQSPTYSGPLSPSLLNRRTTKRILLIPAPAPFAQWIGDDASVPPSVIAQVNYVHKSKPEDDDFEDELEVLREQEEQEKGLIATVPEHSSTSAQRVKAGPEAQVKTDPKVDEFIDDELEALLIQEQEEEEEQRLVNHLEALLIREQEEGDNQGRIILAPRTEEEYRQLQPFSPSSVGPRPPDSNFTSLYEIWSSALEAYYHPNDPTAPRKGKTPIPATDLLDQITTLEKAGKLLSPSFPKDGPPCPICGHPSTLSRVSASNPNGNAHRPFYKCKRCDKFTTWADLGGVLAENPTCDCVVDAGRRAVLPSRMTVTSRRAAAGPGKVFYTCCEVRCGFWSWRGGDEPATGKGDRGRW